MTKYWVYSSEMVYYITAVEADSKEEAVEKVENGDVELGEPTDGDAWEITDVVESFNEPDKLGLFLL